MSTRTSAPHARSVAGWSRTPASVATGKSLADSKSSDFLVRRYAHQQFGNRESGKDKKAADYSETLYWNPLLITDANGRAEIVFDLSDAVTTYRILVDGHQDGRITSSSSEIKVHGK